MRREDETNPNANSIIDRGIVNFPIRNERAETSNDANSRNKEKWQPNSTLIAGDSILNGLIERKISKSNYPVKNRVIPGGKISDMYNYLIPLCKKKSANVILHKRHVK